MSALQPMVFTWSMLHPDVNRHPRNLGSSMISTVIVQVASLGISERFKNFSPTFSWAILAQIGSHTCHVMNVTRQEDGDGLSLDHSFL